MHDAPAEDADRRLGRTAVSLMRPTAHASARAAVVREALGNERSHFVDRPLTSAHTTARTLSSFRDVLAALEEPSLTLSGAPATRLPSRDGDADERGVAIPSAVVAHLLPIMRRSAELLVRDLPAEEPLDLVSAFAEPWCRGLALASVGRSGEDGVRTLALARAVFQTAAHATTREAAIGTTAELVELARELADVRSPLAVQTFVALAYTLPLALAGTWRLLLSQPGAWRELRETPGLRASAIEELLRLAGPARAVFRRATVDVTLGRTRVRAGEELVLQLQQANRCPAHFSDPDRYTAGRFAAGRQGPRHFALGLAPHACAGGALVRLAVDVSTAALLDAFESITLVGPVTWLDGGTIHAPDSLGVVLRRAAQRETAEGLCEP